RRILVPAMAAALASGRPEWVDAATILVCWISVFAGAYWLGSYAALRGRSPYWGAIFLLFPAVIASIDRLVAAAAPAPLAAGVALFTEKDRPVPLYATLSAAALTRESGLILLAAYLVSAVSRGRLRHATLMSTAALPCLAWYWFVHQHTETFKYPVSWI